MVIHPSQGGRQNPAYRPSDAIAFGNQNVCRFGGLDKSSIGAAFLMVEVDSPKSKLMPHFANAAFWAAYDRLPPEIRKLADRCFGVLQLDPKHPSLHLKRVGRFWSARVGSGYRALGVEAPDGIVWIWIGTHEQYDQIIRS